MKTRAFATLLGMLLLVDLGGCPKGGGGAPTVPVPPATTPVASMGGGEEPSPGLEAPGGGDTPLAGEKKGEALPEIAPVKGLDPNGAEKSVDLDRGDALFAKQNWKDAEAAYRKALDAGLKRDAAWKASNQILLCTLRLSQFDRAEEAARETIGRFLGTIDEARAYRILGNLYLTLPHQGTEKGGKFLRGVYDQGIYRFSYRKDRRLAVLALEKARDLFAAFDDGEKKGDVPEAAKDKLRAERVEEVFDLVTGVVSYGPYDSTWSYPWFAWTDYEETEGTVDEELNPHGYGGFRGKGDVEDGGGPGEAGWPNGIPVAQDGSPLFDSVPPGLAYKADLGPGLKMKLLLSEIEKLDPRQERDYAARARLRRATLAKNRYGTERLYQWAGFWSYGKQPLMEEVKKWAIHDLKDDEALTLLGRRLAVVKLPEDENVLGLFYGIEKDFPKSKLTAEGLYAAGFYHQSREQFTTAIADYEAILARHGSAPRASSAKSQIEAIKAPEAVIEQMGVQLLGGPIAVKVAHRNITTIHFTAQEIDLKRYMDDVWADIESDRQQKRYYRDPGNLSYDLLQRTEGNGNTFAFQRYLIGAPVPFEATVKDDGSHRYTTEDVAFPAKLSGRHGTFVVDVDLKDSLGAVSRNLVLIQDTALVEKRFKGQNLYMVANAVDGRPITGAPVRVLQYWDEWKQPLTPGGQGQTIYHHQSTETAANGDGIALVSCVNGRSGSQAIAMVALPDGRLAFSGLRYFSAYYPGSRASGTRAIVFTDRPVYRPGQKVQAKVWIRNLVNGVYQESAKGSASWSVTDPKGQKAGEGTMQLDDLGGGSFSLDIAPKDDEPPLGVYTISIGGASYQGGNVFRVEEYRKPEYEVTVEAGNELARLGDKVSGKIKATYLFGAPVSDARVTYRIYREEFQLSYFAPSPWDWLYGPGYGWCYYDYGFYPWWGLWGCKRFLPWIPFAPSRELVGEGQGRLSADGTMDFTIDSAPALRDHPDTDHRYVVVAEVTDASRRTITGEGQVIVTRHEFEAYVDVDRGYYLPDEEVVVHLRTMTATETPVAASGKLTFARVKEQAAGEGSAVTDTPELVKEMATDAEGNARLTVRTKSSGQFVIRYETKDSSGQTVFGSAVIWVCGADFEGATYRMNDIEILTDKRTYLPGETAHVLVHSDQKDGRVLFATRTDNGTLLDYRMLALRGKSASLDVPVAAGDVPNFFLEGTTIFAGNVHQEAREVFVPPQGSTMDVVVTADKTKVGPGGECKVTVQTKTADGLPVRAQIALSVFDRAVLQIQGEMTPEIRKWFWGDRRTHAFDMDTNLRRALQPTTGRRDPRTTYAGGIPEDWDGGFGNRWLSVTTANEKTVLDQLGYVGGVEGGVVGGAGNGRLAASSPPARAAESAADAAKPLNKEEASRAAPEAKKAGKEDRERDGVGRVGGEVGQGPLKGATVRRTFADTALFVAAVDTTDEGVATVTIPFPQNLTTWRIKTLGMTRTTRVGQGEGSVITSKDVIVRLAAPRFFTERDEVVLSANVHNYLKTAKKAQVTLSLPPELLELSSPATASVDVKPDGEARVDWKVKAKAEGLASIKVEALTDEESDATEMAFPVLVHGFMKTVSVTGSIRPTGPNESSAMLSIPAERRPDRSELSLRVSPSLGLAMVDALPYLIDYPYGCTEQTMSRFVPAVLTRKTLQKMGVDLADLEKTHANLNAQQVGSHRYDTKDPDNPPVYSDKELKKVIKASLKRISEFQRPDGGWGWWADDTPSTYLTAYVVWGLLEARDADVGIDNDMLRRGIAALASGVRHDMIEWKKSEGLGNEQAWLAYVLSTARKDEVPDAKILGQVIDLCFERRINLSLYGKALLSLALRNAKDVARADLVLENARQKEQKDPENETVFYPTEGEYWWYWWNSDIESQAWVLRAILAKDPHDPAAPGLVKWLLNNRKNGTYWRSTKDTAIAISAFADYVQATGETEPDMTVKVAMDGKVLKEMRITKQNLFTFDNVVSLAGADLGTGDHKLTVTRQGKGPVYWNAECSYFTLEEGAKKAGLEIKVERTYFRLERDDATVTVPGARLQEVKEKRVRYKRIAMKDGDRVTTGDLLEIELKLTSKNDYDYLVFEDPKPAGCEPVEVRSGAHFGELCSNMELRDEKVAFFISWLNQGDHLIHYRLRAESPGTFHTLPTRGYAMYAPELKCNADEIVFGVNDREP